MPLSYISEPLFTFESWSDKFMFNVFLWLTSHDTAFLTFHSQRWDCFDS